MPLCFADRLDELQRRKHKIRGGVKDEVKWHLVVGHLNRTQHFFGVVDVDIAGNREAEQAPGLLPVHQKDDARFAPLKLRDLAILQGRLDR